jgi:transcriptional regulator with XRE-family HTH domain
MLSPYAKVAKKVIAGRRRLGLSQRRLGWKLGCGQAYISQVETGRRPLAPGMAPKLEKLFRLKPGSLTLKDVRRGRPRHSEEARRVLRVVASRYRPRTRATAPATTAPRHPRPHQRDGLTNPLWPMAIHLGEEAAAEVLRLEKRRQRDARFWRLLNGLHFDSWTEKRLLARLALQDGVELAGISPSRLGCALPVVHGLSGKDVAQQPAPTFLFHVDDVAVGLLPQRCVRTARGYRWPDLTVVLARGEKRVTAVAEIHGAEYHADATKDELRTRELGVPVLTLDAGAVGDNDLDLIFEWIRKLMS